MQSLQEFITLLKNNGELKVINEEVSTYLEITEIHRRTLINNGPALLFNNVVNKDGKKIEYPMLVNLFGNRKRILLGLNKTEDEYKRLGELLALMRYPKPINKLKEALPYFSIFKKILTMKPIIVNNAASQQKQFFDENINVMDLPIQWCWPNEPAPLITWGLVLTKPFKSGDDNSYGEDYNLGIYRLQVLDKDKLIIRWLRHRGGAMHFQSWKQKYKNENMPIAIVIGADPALILSAVMPLPENMSEVKFSGLLRGKKTELVKAKTVDLLVPSNAEIIIEGYVSYNEEALEGPYGDHTGYYNSEEMFPVVKITAITTNKRPVYLSTYTGRPPDEPAMLALTLNDLFIPIIKSQFLDIVDFYLLPEACSYRTAVVSINKSYPGQSRKVAMGIWSYLNQFMYTKIIIVIDSDLNPRNFRDVNWAISTNVDPIRDVSIIDNTPMDYLDFSSKEEHLASKMIIDATSKIFPETKRKWGKKITMQEDIVNLVNEKWKKLNIF